MGAYVALTEHSVPKHFRHLQPHWLSRPVRETLTFPGVSMGLPGNQGQGQGWMGVFGFLLELCCQEKRM